MKIMALDSSGLAASVAIVEDGSLVAEYTTQYKKTHSQTLLPMLEEIKEMIELDLNTVDAIAIAAGPGSFTGLRIGSATAKGLGLALNIPIIPVPTVDALAYNLYGANAVICPIMDARRSQVYTGLYEFVAVDSKEIGTEMAQMDHKMELKVIKEQCAVPFIEIAGVINDLGKNVVFLGDGVPVFCEQMKELIRVPYYFAAAGQSCQKATSVAELGEILYKKGCYESAAEHAPEYLRMSQAEREKKERDEEVTEAEVVRKDEA